MDWHQLEHGLALEYAQTFHITLPSSADMKRQSST